MLPLSPCPLAAPHRPFRWTFILNNRPTFRSLNGLAISRSRPGEQTLASDKPSSLPDTVRETTLRWSAAGGSRSESVLAPASLYLTALIEHVGEWTLAALARVVARDSSSNMGSVAEVQDVYVALCKDEALWGLFKGMNGEWG